MLNVVSIESRLQGAFYDDVILGLARLRKSIPCRWLYDERGSDIFEKITLLDEYYPTRTETSILRENAVDIARFIAHTVALMEFGAGSGIKTEILLAASSPLLYVPIDICGNFLNETANRIRRLFPWIETRPIVADFTEEFTLPSAVMHRGARTVFFPGSTIGNLTVPQAGALLRSMRIHAGPFGRAIIGVDLKKDLKTLLRAYDDSQGITAAFNLNLLKRMNSELAADFEVDQFAHEARWNANESAVEMHLVSRGNQEVAIGDRHFRFRIGETIHTESSRKYDVDGFTHIVRSNGWDVSHVWQDPDRLFSVFGLVAN